VFAEYADALALYEHLSRWSDSRAPADPALSCHPAGSRVQTAVAARLPTTSK
jgi:hypothetical protein